MTTHENAPGVQVSSAVMRQLKRAFELSSDGIAFMTTDHVLIHANKAWLEMHGLEGRDEVAIVGRPLRSFHIQSQVESELVPFLDCLAKVGSAQGPLGQVRCDGDPFQTWTTASRVDPEGDEPATYVVLSRDLSGERTAATALRRTSGFLDSIVDNIPDMVFVKSADDLRFVLMNRAGEELLGHAQGDFIGKSDYELFPAEEASALIEKDRAVLLGKTVVEVHEEPIHTRHNGVRWFHTKKLPLFDARGKPRYLLGIAEDVTEHRAYKEAQAKLRVAHEAVNIRDEFLSIASHQLNNPLGAALLQADSLIRMTKEPGGTMQPRAVARIESLHRVIVRMAKLVREFLDVSKIDAGHLDLHPEEVDLVEVVRDCTASLTDQLGRSGSTLTIHADAPVVGSWDRLRIEEVVSNLIANAIKYGRGMPIEVFASLESRSARLAVTDHGMGIATADQAHIFQRFERANAARTFTGFGLGLWIAQQIVLAHGGTVQVTSALGEGSTFVLELPLRAGSRPPIQ